MKTFVVSNEACAGESQAAGEAFGADSDITSGNCLIRYR
jgi:hypothetical protein